MTWVYNATPEQEALSRFPTIIAVNMIFTTIMIAVVAMRLWIRKKTLASDDWITVVTAGFCITYNVMCVVQTRYGLGLTTDDRPKANVLTFGKLSYAGKPWYQFGIAGFKLALCISYLRLTEGSGKRFYRFLIIFVGVFSTVCHFVFLCIVLFICSPIDKNWLPETPGYCLPFGPTNYTMASLSIGFDVVIFLLPIPLFMSLSMNIRMKLSLCFLFGLGLLTTLCSIIRATYLPNVAYGNGDNSMVVMLGTVEFNVGIIVSCLPFLRPLFKSLGEWRSRYTSKGRSNAYRMDEIGGNYESGSRSRHVVESKIGRSESEEEIFGFKRNNIVKTVHYEVQSEELRREFPFKC